MKVAESRAETLVGVFVLLTVIGLVALVALAGFGSGWFVPKLSYRLVLDSGRGITPGVDVMVAGMKVGHVAKTSLTAERKVELLLEVDEEYSEFVLVDSVGQARMTMSGKVIEIEAGSPAAAVMPDGGTLVSGENVDPIQVLQDLDLIDTLERLQAVLEDIEQVSSQLHLGQGELPELIASLQTITNDLAAGKGSVGRLLKEDGLVNKGEATLIQVDAMVANLDKAALDISTATASIETMSRDIAGATEQLGKGVDAVAQTTGSLDGTLQQLPETMRALNVALDELHTTMRAIQNVPLVRGQVEKVEEAGE